MGDFARHGTATLDLPCAVHFSDPGSVEINEVPDGLVIYDTRHSQVHYLNPTAAAILLLCTGESRSDAIADEIQALWGLPESPTKIVRECIADLVDRGLVVG